MENLKFEFFSLLIKHSNFFRKLKQISLIIVHKIFPIDSTALPIFENDFTESAFINFGVANYIIQAD
jgi:hypothetical protein